MDAMGLPIILFLAQSIASLGVSREYHFVNQKKTWTEAQRYCREKFADLATVETVEDWARVREMVVESNSRFLWIGLYDDVDSWRWSLDNSRLYDGRTADLGDWFVFTRDGIGSREHCAGFGAGILCDRSCEDSLNSVCFDEPSNKYIPIRVPMSWPAAQNHCREQYTDLATMKTQQEKNDIMSVIGDASAWWIGLSRDGWKWSDRSESSFRVWAPGQPWGVNSSCVGASEKGFNDNICGHEKPFICSAPTKKIVQIVLRTQGSLDLKDPKVQEAILKHMEEQLRDQGIDQQFKLRWTKQPNCKVSTTTCVRV